MAGTAFDAMVPSVQWCNCSRISSGWRMMSQEQCWASELFSRCDMWQLVGGYPSIWDSKWPSPKTLTLLLVWPFKDPIRLAINLKSKTLGRIPRASCHACYFWSSPKAYSVYYSWLTFLHVGQVHLVIPVGKHANFVKIKPWLEFLILPISTPNLFLFLLSGLSSKC